MDKTERRRRGRRREDRLINVDHLHPMTQLKKKILIFAAIMFATFMFFMVVIGANWQSVTSNPAVLLFASVLFECVSLIVFFMMWSLLNAFSRVIEFASRINEGDLSASMPIDSKDEIGDLARLLNNLSVNQQEILLFTGATANDTEALFRKLLHDRGILDDNDANIKSIFYKIHELKKIVSQFEYYNVIYDEKSLQGNEPSEVIEKLKAQSHKQ